MDSSSENVDDSCEDTAEYKKSRGKSLKTRIFGRSQRATVTKLSQSASDINAEKEHGSDDDLSSQGSMGSRALSHDSIFMEENVLTEPEPSKVLSQENVNSKIKALQLKLQQQNLRLGPPPLALPIRRPAVISKDEYSSYRSAEVTGSDVPGQESISKASSRPLSPALTKCPPSFPSHPLPVFPTSRTCASEPPLDFSSPPYSTTCLDTSAARHRMSVKPRNQRASTKKRVAPTNSVKGEEKNYIYSQEKATLEEEGDVDIYATRQHFPSKSQVATDSYSQTSHLQEPALTRVSALVSSQVLRPQPQRAVDVTSSEKSNSSVVSEPKTRREAGFDIQVSSYEKKNTIKITEEPTDMGSHVTFELSAAHKQLQEEIKSINFPKRPGAGAASVHFSITSAKSQHLERPRSSSFVGKVEQPESKHKTGTEKKFTSSLKEKVSLRDPQPRGSTFTVGKLTQEGAAPKSSDHSWERKDNQEKKDEFVLVFASKIAAAGTGTLTGQGSESRQEEVEVAVDKQAFGIKLRSTSQSLRYRPASGDQLDKQTTQGVGEHGVYMSKETPANIPPSSTTTGTDFTVTDPTLPGTSCNNPTVARAKVSDIRETETSSSVPQDPPALQTASTEVSWMSLAVEKTKGLQQLLARRLPRDITGTQTTRVQTQAQPPQQTEVQTSAQVQAVKLQQSSTVTLQAVNQAPTAAVKAARVQGSCPAHTVKASLVPLQQKTAASALVKLFPESQTSPQTTESQTQSGPTHCSSHPLDQNKPWTTQSFFQISKQTEISSPLARESATQSPAPSSLSSGQNATQQPPWSIRGLQPTNQLKSTASVSTTSVTTAPPSPVSVLGRDKDKEVIVQENISTPLAKRALRDRPGSERAAFLHKRAEWTTVTATTEVDAKRAQTDTQSPEQPMKLVRTSSCVGAKPEWKQGVKLSDSVPDRSREDKWLRKNVVCSSLPTQSSVLQSMSDNAPPFWMELAKRKSMAWSDKAMD